MPPTVGTSLGGFDESSSVQGEAGMVPSGFPVLIVQVGVTLHHLIYRQWVMTQHESYTGVLFVWGRPKGTPSVGTGYRRSCGRKLLLRVRTEGQVTAEANLSRADVAETS